MEKILKFKWIKDPPPPWLIKDRDLFSKFENLGKEFDKRFDALHLEFTQKVNGMKR